MTPFERRLVKVEAAATAGASEIEARYITSPPGMVDLAEQEAWGLAQEALLPRANRITVHYVWPRPAD